MATDNFPYIPLNEDQKRFCKQILLRANMLMNKWGELYSERERHVFRRKIMAGEINYLDKIPQKKMKELKEDLPVIHAPRKIRCPELAGRTVEEAVLSGFVALCRQHARMWTREGDPNGITYDDYLQEAYTIILGAMYAFTRDDVDLSTFFWWVLKNRMINVTNQQQFLRLKNDDLKLVVTYEKTRNNAHQHVTFDEIVKLMGLDKETASHLSTLLTRIYIENQISLNGEDMGDEGSSGSGDYTACRAGCLHEDETGPVVARLTVQTAIEKANLSDFEKIVIRAFLEDDSLGWQTRLANSLKNPQTGKHYSRMWVTITKNSAMEKLRKYMVSADAA